jgi:ribonucleotide reductase beta subunit family protein with ferritin-like domain
MDRKKIYNPDSIETTNSRKIFGGDPTGIFELNDIKYQWAYNLWEVMLNNTWFPKEVDMTQDIFDYKRLTDAEKMAYDKVLAQLIFMDSLQTNNLIDNINPFITSPEINLILVRQAFEEALHCYVEGTEVLTSEGFIDFRDVKDDTLIANYHENGDITFTEPTEIIVGDYSGDIYRFEGQRYNLAVTPNHRMVRLNMRENGRFETKLAEDISLHNYKAPVAGYTKGNRYREFTPLDRFRIAYQADGTISNGGNVTENGIMYKFYLNKERKIDRLLKIAEDGNFKFTKKESEDSFFNIYIWVDERIDKNFDWIKLDEISLEWGLEFLEELTYWDGSRSADLKRYSNTNKKAINKVMGVASICGVRVGVDKSYTTGFKEYWTLNFIDTDYVSGRSIKKTKEPYSGKIYCVTVPSSYIIVKYSDKIAVSGNSQSYAVMVDSISTNTNEIYQLWRRDMMLKSKNDAIAQVYEELAKNPTDNNILKAMFANQILEGIYFYSGFAYIYTLARSGKMLGSAQMIRFIQRDEVTHLILFQNMIKSTRRERPELFTKELIDEVYDMFREAVELESSWGKYITQGQILGLTDSIIEQYIQYLADKRLEAIGFDRLYGVEHPIRWVENFSSFNDQKTNFFEGNVTNYSKGSLNFDDF